ncbi:hypothetical protein [Psychromonas ossibalaenae]|uniref:hypothetical protein n=1 Tax=Psychromonas ossibalaenae TaxID=444922 RepID=UPI0003715B8B|nr:hypothetical protein [Psychromonas ossibalaenae]
MYKSTVYVFLSMLVLLLSGCSTASHGTFISNTFIDQNIPAKGLYAADAVGESAQTWFLYIIPMGEAPSTNAAIENAKQQNHGTKYLTDLSIDDRTAWHFGYSIQSIKVEGKAYK